MKMYLLIVGVHAYL